MIKKIIVLISLMFSCCDIFAATYWISPDGRASATGSESDPFASAQMALGKVGGGNTFIFKPGDYIGTQITLSPAHAGSSQQPTILKSQYKYEAVLHGSRVHNIYIMKGCEWVIIDGFESSGAGYTGIKSDADYTVIRNCRIHNNALQGIEAHGVYGTVIENNIIEYNGANLQFSHGVYADGDGLTIRNNIVRFNSGWGLHLYPEIADSIIENNLIYANARWGIGLYSKPAIGSNMIVNNTIVLNGSGITFKNAQNEIIANNIIVDNTGWQFDTTEPIHNLDGGRPDRKKVMIDYNLCLPAFSDAGPHGISADPLFLDPQKGTFYLKQDSPAIAKGSGEYGPNRDFFNRIIPEDKNPDLGCFPFEPSLLLPKAREQWYYQWPFFCRGKNITMPDLWMPPETSEPEKK